MTLSDIVSIVGTVISCFGFGFTIFQLHKTKSIAEAAKLASEDTKAVIQQLDIIISIHKVTSKSNELIAALRSRNFSIAVFHVMELRNDISKLKGQQPENSDYLSKFDQHLAMLTEIHSYIEKSSMNRFDNDRIADIILKISEICDYLSEISSQNVFLLTNSGIKLNGDT
ncbi:hypothetical protein [Neisseria dumasiana]|uniref:hypothetical protein n=1 Tax=Neisseria dumasiana TaxID=1931275 RepID=UPI000A18D204|nr:hypothetical protein [Neisseria dumasiana]OSI14155.1 hypothetical protein BV914_10770 [Neisseria dumasiana]